MPKQKDLKRLVRTRMQKTGESYTTARVQITRSKSQPNATLVDYAALAGMTDVAIKARTGKTWAQWVRALDAIDAMKMTHTNIAKHVHERYQIDGWWSQSVTVGYERIRGLREKGQRRSGRFNASKSKTLPVPAQVAFDAFVDARTRKKWLGGVDVTIRKATSPKSVRIGMPDGSIVAVWITAKGEKCAVGVQADNLPTREEAKLRKAYWTEKLAVLEELLVD